MYLVPLKILYLVMLSVGLFGCAADKKLDLEADKESSVFKKKSTEKYVIFSPLKGVLVQNGTPLPRVKIIRNLSWNGSDGGVKEEFYTDENGHFSLPIREENLSLNMLDQFVAKADLEYELNGEKHYLWSSSKFFPEIYTETDGPISGLICDISMEEIPVPMGPTSILTLCRWENMPK